jgi:hypothetical protein
MFLLKPHKNHLNKNAITLLTGKAKATSLKVLSGLYQSLLYAPSTITRTLGASQAETIS